MFAGIGERGAKEFHISSAGVSHTVLISKGYALTHAVLRLDCAGGTTLSMDWRSFAVATAQSNLLHFDGCHSIAPKFAMAWCRVISCVAAGLAFDCTQVAVAMTQGDFHVVGRVWAIGRG
jgi:hypothetical protein